MSKVVITKSKLDSLANSVAAKSGVPVLMTVDEMKEAVDSILVPSGKLDITENGEYDVTRYETVDTYITPSVGTLNIHPIDDKGKTFNASSNNLDGYSKVIVDSIEQ